VGRAVVRATREGLPPAQAVSDDDGDFDLGDLDPGKWRLVALHEGSFPSRPQEVDLVQDETGIRIDLSRLQGTLDEEAGKEFFIALLIGLGALVVFWIVLHALVPGKGEPLSLTTGALITQAVEQVNAVDDISQSDEVGAAISDIKTNLDALIAQNLDLSATDSKTLRDVFAGIDAAVKANGKADAVRQLTRLRQLVVTPPSSEFALWGQEPLRFFEIFLWGLAGVLVNKIITVGWYLRNQRFYREGIVMHVANIATAPLLVLVTVFLLSLFTLQVTLAGSNEVTIDLSDPRLLVAVSFLLGSQPWSIWDFARETARRFTGRQD
jgi:hypothetical protein